MIDIYVPFIRQEGIDLTTFSILKFKVKEIEESKVLIEKFISVLTQWVINTENGKKAWEYSSGDFNVGDLYSFEDEIRGAMSKELMAVGIHDFEIVWGGDSKEVMNFDTVLVDSSKLDEE